MRPLYLYTTLLLVVLVSCSTQKEWSTVKNTTEYRDIARYLIENEHPSHVKKAWNTYFTLREQEWSQSPPACFLNTIDISTDSVAQLFLEYNTIKINTLKDSLLTKLIKRDTSRIHLRSYKDPDNMLRKASNFMIAINIAPNTPLTLHKTILSNVHQALDSYKNGLCIQWFGASYNQTATYKRAWIDNFVYNKITFFKMGRIPPPPPPPFNPDYSLKHSE
ncbi:hypothetical protein [Neptunitalea lumnitzerae]|uniref:Lipoprotein n=1 Tax=Neptunitalea lumnitzerae TaxID=2965509 RepID=A0ABQ5MFW8_9FLAO|nr:hypothetical protein [Neptunitalea sp. Y10]GLB47787.1 hypothetical protein Y10_01550 [Neptunitalea sp. Y10]